MAEQDDRALIESIDAAIAGNPDGITVEEVRGRRVERMSLNQLLRARATIEARMRRAKHGVFRRAPTA